VGLPDSTLVPTWAAPITTTFSDGTPCLGNLYDLEVRTRILTLH
jgi:hypothetical protein